MYDLNKKWTTTKKNIKAISFKNPLIDDQTRIYHENIIIDIAERLCKNEHREFIQTPDNLKVIRYLMYYFNGDKRAFNYFPNTSLCKGIILVGKPGCGKTLIMQVYSEYLKATNNPHAFKTVSTTQMANHYKLHSNIDAYTYNEKGAGNFDGNPLNICMNDVGIISKQKFFGTDVDDLMEEFLFARYEIYQNKSKRTHLTSNLDTAEFKKKYEARLVDRFKSYNVIPLLGGSFRK